MPLEAISEDEWLHTDIGWDTNFGQMTSVSHVIMHSATSASFVKTAFACHFFNSGAPVAQWVKRWPTDLADQVRSSLEVKSSQP